MSTEPTVEAPRGVEANGINVISEGERKGRPRDLFWPWCAANISVLGISYGAWILAFGVSATQAIVAGVVGAVVSFVLVGLVATSGTAASAPTMVVSRAAFGVRGNALPAAVSYLLLIGWETVLCALATLATATVFGRLGWGSGNTTKVIAFLVVAAIIVFAGVFGFDVIMKLQTYLTIALAVLTVGYVALTWSHVSADTVGAVASGSTQAFIGALIFAMTGFGLGWVNSGGDYARYLPRTSSKAGVIGWTTVGASIAPVILVFYGVLLAASDEELNKAVSSDPIGALTGILPTWFLVPFAVVAIGGLIGGAVLDIYSSGLALLALGLKIPRWAAAGIDGVVMILGTVYFVWIADSFFFPFQGFLITLSVPIAAWCGVFLADLIHRRGGYREADFYDARGHYGAVNPVGTGAMVVASLLGWGLVTNSYAGWLGWQGYLLGPFGLGGREGAWAYANLGVLAALGLAFVLQLALGRTTRRSGRDA